MLKPVIKKVLVNAAYYSGLIKALRNRRGSLILMFHKVNDAYDPIGISIAPDIFEELINEICKYHEIVSVNSPDFNASLTKPKKPLQIAITFDDGYYDNYTNAFPVLKHLRIPATIYLSTDFIYGKADFWYEQVIHAVNCTPFPCLDLSEYNLGIVNTFDNKNKLNSILYLNNILKNLNSSDRNDISRKILDLSGTESTYKPSRMLNWDNVNEMKNHGIDFGSHTVSHPILANEDRVRIKQELLRSKEIIESHTGQTVHSLAYPNGRKEDYNEAVIREAENSGYINACTTCKGINDGNKSLFELSRVNISNASVSIDAKNLSRPLFWSKVLLPI